jgi:hypothetical protein
MANWNAHQRPLPLKINDNTDTQSNAELRGRVIVILSTIHR